MNGERAYKLAREGNAVELPPRPVTIYDLILREVKPPLLRLSVTCSAGTYIRALGRDMGKMAGCPLTMSFLLRSEMGPFSIAEAKTLEEIEADPEGALMTDLRPLLSALPLLALDEKEAADFLLGKRLRTQEKPVEVAAAFCGPRFLGTARVERGVIHPKKVFN